MLFKPEHKKMIIEGQKTATRRNWKKRMAKTGGTYAVQTRMFQPKIECSIIKANDVYQQRLGDMTESDAMMEGRYTPSEFKKVFERINGFWDADLIVWVVEFKLIKTIG